ncbi:MAG: hypothetical protein IPM29_15675 [Planctomycetes bacterium]|nr:hypothetical protein [Planctomycetota bacterium]
MRARPLPIRAITTGALLAALALAPSPLTAQNRASLIYCGRFPFVGLDAVNERPGGSINQLSEFAITTVTPGAGAVARCWLPATGDEAFLGDPAGNRNYTFYAGFKTYFQRINKCGLFVKHADKARHDVRRVYWTVRDDPAQARRFVVFDRNAGATVTLRQGDFVRLTENGNLEFFITQTLFDTAMGMQSGSFTSGASALCQDAQGNLYYSPAEGGHWVNGNQTTQFCNDGSICMIPAAAITYDARGNVAAVLADSAMLLFEETNGTPSIRDMVQTNAGAFRNDGTPIDGSTAAQRTTNLVGLDLDPNGGTLLSAFTDPQGNPVTVPNLVFTWDQGTWGGSIFTTGPNLVGLPGAIATINGVRCGSTTSGVPADGSWLGVQLDVGNFQPTLLGLQVFPQELPYVPAVADVADFGALPQTAASVTLDFFGPPNAGMFLAMTIGPFTPGSVTSSLDVRSLFGTASFNTIFTIPNAQLAVPVTGLLGITDQFGYFPFTLPNPNTGAAVGALLVFHGIASGPAGIQVTNPAVIQYK